MRYTTIIDITALPIYRNQRIRLVYLHMVLASGYHADDQDQVRLSIRGLAAAVGLTLSATRHAIAALRAAGLVEIQGGVFLVKKFIRPVLAAPRNGKTLTAGDSQQTGNEDKRARLERELERLRRWYQDATARHDDESAQEIRKEAEKIKRQIRALQ